jgi:hypothetical protein
MNRVHRFVVVLISVIAAPSCFAQSLAQSLPRSANGQTPALIASNYVPVTGTIFAGSTGAETSTAGAALDLKQASPQPSAMPDAPSPLQTRLNFEPAKSSFEAPGFEETLTNQDIYDETMATSKAGKLTHMINSIMSRFDMTDVATAPGIRSSAGLSSDTSFAVSRHLALVGTYQHNSYPSFDTMGLGVAFTFGRNAN